MKSVPSYNNVITEYVLTMLLIEEHFSMSQNKSAAKKPQRKFQ